MKNTFLVLSIIVTIIGASIFFSSSGCSNPKPETKPIDAVLNDSISNKYAIQPIDIASVSQVQANLFSWQSFIAMNWPAAASGCGPDTSNGMSILSGNGPVVWETYLTSEQVFVASPNQPDAWCASGNGTHTFKKLPKKIQELANKTGVYRFMHLSSKSPHGLEEAVGGPLVDQNGRFVRYEVRMNEVEYNYIMKNTLWNSAGQQAFVKDSTINFPVGSTQNGTLGAMEFKAAWKVLGKGDDPSKFYTIKAIVYNDDTLQPSPGDNPVTLGLVGLHIGHKTQTQGNWVWSTFEQVDNLTKSFFNPNCDTCPVNQPIAGTNYVELNPNGTPVNAPTQVTRVNPINDPSADSLNAYFQNLLKGSVWANYQLVSTQWLFFETMTPLYLANSVQETYVQGPNPPSYGGFKLRPGFDVQYFTDPRYNPFAPGVSSSCMGCHYVATIPKTKAKADFSFMLGEAK
ncbi:MAG: hypothetical protein ACRCYO_11815 [Bacteroidia bacterium]